MTKVKSLGQYFTPSFIAEFMINLISHGPKTRRILEPSAGKGIFLEKLAKKGYQNIIGLEIDPSVAKYSPIPIKIGNFFDFSISEQFDIVIGNPPYIRWKNLNQNQRNYFTSSPFWNKRMNGLTDILQPFIFKSIDHLKEGGELIFITPTFWTQTLHAESLRRFLIENGSLELIINFHESRIFPNVNLNLLIFKYKKIIQDRPIKIVNYLYKGKLNKESLHYITDYIKNQSIWKYNSIIQRKLEFFQIGQHNNSQPWNFLPNHILEDLMKFEKSCYYSPRFVINRNTINLTDLYSNEDLLAIGCSKKSFEKVKIENKTYYSPQNISNLTHYFENIDKKDNLSQRRYARIGDIVEIANGMVSGLDKAFKVNSDKHLNENEKKLIIPVIKAKAIRRFFPEFLTDYFLIKSNQIPSEEILKSEYPSVYYHLEPYRNVLEKRYQYNRIIPFWEWVFIRNYKLMNETKEKLICVPCKDRFDTRGYLRFAICENGTYTTQDVTVLIRFKWVKESIEYITAFLNSDEVFEWVINKGFTRGGVAEFSEEPLKSIPFRFINWNSTFEVKVHNKIKELVNIIYHTKKENKIIESEINNLISRLLNKK